MTEPRIRIIGDVCVADLVGDLTIVRRDVDPSALTRDLLGRGQRKILLRIQGLTGLDSTGIGELIAAYKLALRAGAVLKIAAGPLYDRLYAGTFGAVCKMFVDDEEALRSFEDDQESV